MWKESSKTEVLPTVLAVVYAPAALKGAVCKVSNVHCSSYPATALSHPLARISAKHQMADCMAMGVCPLQLQSRSLSQQLMGGQLVT